MLILITGSSGFIGRELAKACRKRGIDIVVPSTQTGDWRLGADLALPKETVVTHAVHLAYDFGAVNQAEANVLPTIKVIDELRAYGVGFQCYVSSFSAGSHAKSSYGATKFAIENLSRGADIAIVRPGLVTGQAGIWGKISRFVIKFRVAVIPGGASFVSPSIEVGQLCESLIRICEEEKSGLFFATSNPNQTFKSLIAREFGHLAYVEVSPPIWFIKFSLIICELIRIKLPISRDNLEGFLGNQTLADNRWVSKGDNLWVRD